MKQYGLIGKSLEHSFSKRYFTEKFEREKLRDCSYDLYPLDDINKIEQLFEQKNISGLNVTIPYKESIIPFLDEIDRAAKRIGAVNVVKIDKDRKIGYNSDYYGFKTSLEKFLPSDFSSSALILGSGGASKAIKVALQDLSIDFQTVSRGSEHDLSYKDLNHNPDLLQQFHLIVNCTPLGTIPDIKAKPELPYQYLSENHFLYDLVYNPAETAFMQAGRSQGAAVKNGYEMLVLQAEKSWEIWQS